MKPIATVDEIPESGLKFTYLEGPLEAEGLLLRLRDGSVRAYRNECRHLPMPLDERAPSQFYDEGTGDLICSSHSARFRTSDGLCVSGPCRGSHLKALSVRVEDGVVLIDEAATGGFFDV